MAVFFTAIRNFIFGLERESKWTKTSSKRTKMSSKWTEMSSECTETSSKKYSYALLSIRKRTFLFLRFFYFIKSFITSPASISPAEEGTKEILPGTLLFSDWSSLSVSSITGDMACSFE